MIKKILIIPFLLLLPFYLTGCLEVGSKYIIGERIRDDMSDKFDGVWEADEGILYMKYLKNGELHIAGIGWEENKFVLEEGTGISILTKCGDKIFVNYKESETTEYFEFFYCSFIAENNLAVWWPKKDDFEKAINEGVIKGEIKKYEYSRFIRINELPKSFCDFIKNKKIEELFDLEEPLMVLRRIKKWPYNGKEN